MLTDDSTLVSEVYPRVCGGSAAGLERLATGKGLSPRVRGNPLMSAHEYGLSRSIPACAGESTQSSGQLPPS